MFFLHIKQEGELVGRVTLILKVPIVREFPFQLNLKQFLNPGKTSVDIVT